MMELNARDPLRFARTAMIEDLEQKGISDLRILTAMASVPRELFVPARSVDDAYADQPLALSHGQTISQPYIVATMLRALRPGAKDRILEIGTGSGYSAAVLSKLVARVDSVERIPELANSARERLAVLGYRTIHVHCGDGTLGWPEHAPYDAIVVTASGPSIPPALVDQLAIGGRLVMPVGHRTRQDLLRVTKVTAEECAIADLGPVQFVPLIGKQGWLDNDELPFTD